MWQLICLHYPILPVIEQQRTLHLLQEALQKSQYEQGVVDLGLTFLHHLHPDETVTVLQERLDVMMQAQQWLPVQIHRQVPSTRAEMTQLLIQEHIHVMLKAECMWLRYAIQQVTNKLHMQE